MNQIIQILSRSKIYIDFGFHPGVDHLPREAAILKNCIITNKEGSAIIMKLYQLKQNSNLMKKEITLKFRNNK